MQKPTEKQLYKEEEGGEGGQAFEKQEDFIYNYSDPKIQNPEEKQKSQEKIQQEQETKKSKKKQEKLPEPKIEYREEDNGQTQVMTFQHGSDYADEEEEEEDDTIEQQNAKQGLEQINEINEEEQQMKYQKEEMDNYLNIMEQLSNEDFLENKSTKLKIKAGIETTKKITLKLQEAEETNILIYSSDPRYLIIGNAEVTLQGPCPIPIQLVFTAVNDVETKQFSVFVLKNDTKWSKINLTITYEAQ